VRVTPEATRPAHVRRRGLVALGVLAALGLCFLAVQALADLDINYLWFHYAGLGDVFATVLGTKLALGTVFVAFAFGLFWLNLFLVDKAAVRALLTAPRGDLAARFQGAVGPHALGVRTLVALVLALAVGTGASSQWQNWLLFEHAVPFGMKDPVFGRDVSFFVFRLPFLSFLVAWLTVALLVALGLSALAHGLNGGISVRTRPHLEPRALAHLSALAGLLALERAAAYYYVDRFSLEVSGSGVVAGAGYTALHVRLPAITLLAVVCLVAFVLLTFNAYQRTLALPAIALGLWGFLALVIGVLYPAVMQLLKVTPSQSLLERPYIERNIAATRFAMGIDHVVSHLLPANEDLTPGVLLRYAATLDATELWDPQLAGSAFSRLQDARGYYRLTPPAVDRYVVGGTLTPVLVSARALDPARLARPTWVNDHLRFTHGIGAVVAEGNGASATGALRFLVSNVPPSASSPVLRLAQPDVYFAPGENHYVVVDTKEQSAGATSGEVRRDSAADASDTGIPLRPLSTRLAFAIRFGDPNLLVSNLVTARSRLLYLTDVRALVEKALPFLRVDANPYPVLVPHGPLDWMVDAYTTSDSFPYGEPASTSGLAATSGLKGRFDYVRDAVKVVVNAATGRLEAYVVAPSDPLVQAYERIFPGLFHPLSQMPAVLRAHLRYPQDLLLVQAEMYGTYHVTNPASFYSLADAWAPSQGSGVAGPGSRVASALPDEPSYELLQLPDEPSLQFSLVEPLVRASPAGSLQQLAGLFIADSSPAAYGRLEVLQTPGRRLVDGPGLVGAALLGDATVSRELASLERSGSRVVLGSVVVLPIADSVLYVRPVYAVSLQAGYPELAAVAVVYGRRVAMAATLGEAIGQLFGSNAALGAGPSTSGGVTVPNAAGALVATALHDLDLAQAALARRNLGTYQRDVAEAVAALTTANRLFRVAKSASSPSQTTPAAAVPAPAGAGTSSRGGAGPVGRTLEAG